MNRSTILALAVLLASPALAAQVRTAAYGLVKKEGLSICATRATHVLDCSNLRLDAPSLDLVPCEGKYVRVEGVLRSSGSMCTTLTVDKVQQAPEYGTASGTWKPGGTVQFTFFGLPGSLQVLFLSPGKPGFTPLGDLGLFYLKLALHFPLVFLPISGTGSSPWPLKIPNDPALAGLELVFQSGYVVMPQQTLLMANALCGKV